MKKILKFYSPTCGPCKVVSRNLSTLKGVEIQSIDTSDEDNKSLMDEWKVRTVPTVIVLGENNEILGASNVSKNITSGAENKMDAIRTDSTMGTGYNAARTSTDTTTVAGMSQTAWTWLILGVAAIAIIAVVWYYSMQLRSSNYDDRN